MSKINILLPFKEKFSSKIMSSVSISVQANIEKSTYKNEIKIYGQHTQDPLFPDKFIGIKKPWFPFKSKNIHLAKKMCDEIKNLKINDPIIEVHNRPYLVRLIKERVKDARVILFFHNDPLEMRGSKHDKERLSIVKNCSAICFVSKYLKNQYLKNINFMPKNLHILYNGVNYNLKNPVKKEKNIIFVGRLVKEKGAHLFLEAAKVLSKKYNKWKFIVVGSAYLGSEIETDFSRKIVSLVRQLGSNVEFTGYLPHQKSQRMIEKSEILVVPSIWNEPFGLVVAEGMIHGCAIITTNKGGIPEIIQDKGIILETINTQSIVDSIELLINDQPLRKQFQKKVIDNFFFTAFNSSKYLDELRKKIICS